MSLKVFIDMSFILDIKETCLITYLTLVGFYTHKDIKAKLTIVEDILSSPGGVSSMNLG